MIVDVAIRFFAEVGFGGQTRELARKIGISQPLLYKYFPRKEDLVDRVYREVYLGRWNPYWETVLGNDRVPLRDRLTQFYVDYASKIMDYEWIRIFMYAGLLGSGINAKYIDLLRDRVILRICHALRAERGLPRVDDRRISAREEQLVWSLQGSMLYMAIQKYLYGFELDVDLTSAVEDRVDAFLDGVPAVFEALAGPKKRKKSA
ncbi:MAG TPA: TetR/AcrR family transcriptional regulator [Pseudolabrys sp.]|jgi:AcrR family transcriptional regulator